MPANKKYLSTPWQRVAKVTAAIIGGYAVTLSFHLFLFDVMERKLLLATAHFSTFTLWCALMMIAFLAKKGWKIWLWYLALAVLFLAPYFLMKG